MIPFRWQVDGWDYFERIGAGPCHFLVCNWPSQTINWGFYAPREHEWFWEEMHGKWNELPEFPFDRDDCQKQREYAARRDSVLVSGTHRDS